MKRLLPTGLLFLTLLTANAQETKDSANVTSSQEFTLERCVDYALKNSVTMQNAVIDEKISDARVKETRGIGLPQINASATLLHNQKLPRFFGQKSSQNPITSDFPGNEGDVLALENFFQLKSSGDVGVSASQILFNSSYLVGLQAANAYRDLATKNSDRTREDVIENVTKAYYSVLINNDRIGLFETNIARLDSLLKTTSAMFENGFAEAIDVDRVKVSLNNLIVEKSRFVQLQEVSLQLLKFQMNYPMTDPIEVVGDISQIPVSKSVLDQYSAEWSYEQRSDYRLLEANRKLQALNLKNKYAEGLPSLALFGNFGYSTQSPDIGGLFRTTTNIPNEDGVGPDKWYSYSNFGLTLSVPLFSGLQRTYKIQQAKLELQKVDNNFRSLKSGIDLQIKQAAATFLSAVEMADAQKQNSELAANISRVTKIKYQQGVGSNLEVVEAESSLRLAQINYYNALYDAIVAKIDLDKAFGKLNPAQESK